MHTGNFLIGPNRLLVSLRGFLLPSSDIIFMHEPDYKPPQSTHPLDAFLPSSRSTTSGYNIEFVILPVKSPSISVTTSDTSDVRYYSLYNRQHGTKIIIPFLFSVSYNALKGDGDLPAEGSPYTFHLDTPKNNNLPVSFINDVQEQTNVLVLLDRVQLTGHLRRFGKSVSTEVLKEQNPLLRLKQYIIIADRFDPLGCCLYCGSPVLNLPPRNSPVLSSAESEIAIAKDLGIPLALYGSSLGSPALMHKRTQPLEAQIPTRLSPFDVVGDTPNSSIYRFIGNPKIVLCDGFVSIFYTINPAPGDLVDTIMSNYNVVHDDGHPSEYFAYRLAKDNYGRLIFQTDIPENDLHNWMVSRSTLARYTTISFFPWHTDCREKARSCLMVDMLNVPSVPLPTETFPDGSFGLELQQEVAGRIARVREIEEGFVDYVSERLIEFVSGTAGLASVNSGPNVDTPKAPSTLKDSGNAVSTSKESNAKDAPELSKASAGSKPDIQPSRSRAHGAAVSLKSHKTRTPETPEAPLLNARQGHDSLRNTSLNITHDSPFKPYQGRLQNKSQLIDGSSMKTPTSMFSNSELFGDASAQPQGQSTIQSLPQRIPLQPRMLPSDPPFQHMHQQDQEPIDIGLSYNPSTKDPRRFGGAPQPSLPPRIQQDIHMQYSPQGQFGQNIPRQFITYQGVQHLTPQMQQAQQAQQMQQLRQIQQMPPAVYMQQQPQPIYPPQYYSPSQFEQPNIRLAPGLQHPQFALPQQFAVQAPPGPMFTPQLMASQQPYPQVQRDMGGMRPPVYQQGAPYPEHMRQQPPQPPQTPQAYGPASSNPYWRNGPRPNDGQPQL